MSRFYVGQRVRKVGGEWNVGMEGVVVEIAPTDPYGMTIGVILDGPAYGETDDGRAVVNESVGFGYPEDFEPILPPGLESPAEIAALYEPGPVRA